MNAASNNHPAAASFGGMQRPGRVGTSADDGPQWQPPALRGTVAGLPITVTARLWAKVDRSGDCWVWTGGVDAYGYGKMGINGRTVKVHRQAYIETRGPIPDGLTIDHLCRNKLCVNPDHLEAVTAAENLRRSWLTRDRGSRSHWTHCKRGHEFTDETTYRYTYNGRTRRMCRTCDLAGKRAARRAAKEHADSPPNDPAGRVTPRTSAGRDAKS